MLLESLAVSPAAILTLVVATLAVLKLYVVYRVIF